MTDIDGLSALGSLKAGWELFSLPERRRVWRLAPMVAIVGVVEILTMASAMPLVAIIVDRETLTRSETLAGIYAALGSPPFESFVAWLTVFVLVALVLGMAASFLRDYAVERFASDSWARLGHDLMKETIDAPYAWFLRQNASVLTRIFTHDLTLWARDYVSFLLFFFSDLIIIATATIVILIISPTAGFLAIMAVLAAYGGLMTWVRPRMQKLATESRLKSDDLAQSAHEAFSGAKDIKLSSQEEFFVAAFSHANGRVAQARVMITVWGKIAPLLMLLLGQLALVTMAFALWQAGVPSGEIVATMAVIVLVSARLIPALNRMAANVNKIWTVAPYVSGIRNVRRSLHDAAFEKQGRPSSPGKAVPGDWRRLELEDIDFAYGGSKAGGGFVLRNIGLTIERGRTYGLVGPSGAGKSTLVDIVLGLLEPDAGRLLIDGQPLNRFEKASWQRRLAYVPQAPFISDDTLRANVAFGIPPDEADDERVRGCLAAAQLSSLMDELQDGLDTRLGDRGSRLSGGQRQRIAIARALYKDPDLLVLDEATSALDSLNELAVQKAIAELRGKTTLVVIAHRLSTVRDADRIVVFDQGKIVGEGAYDGLLVSCPLFAQLAALQTNAQTAPIQ